MTDEALKYLSDIQKAIGLIEDFSSDTLLFEDYVKDLKTQSAVERQLGIVGEALKKFDSILPDKPLSHTRKIAGFRNRLIHTYDAIDSSMVWVIIKRYLPLLKEEVQSRMRG